MRIFCKVFIAFKEKCYLPIFAVVAVTASLQTEAADLSLKSVHLGMTEAEVKAAVGSTFTFQTTRRYNNFPEYTQWAFAKTPDGIEQWGTVYFENKLVHVTYVVNAIPPGQQPGIQSFQSTVSKKFGATGWITQINMGSPTGHLPIFYDAQGEALPPGSVLCRGGSDNIATPSQAQGVTMKYGILLLPQFPSRWDGNCGLHVDAQYFADGKSNAVTSYIIAVTNESVPAAAAKSIAAQSAQQQKAAQDRANQIAPKL